MSYDNDILYIQGTPILTVDNPLVNYDVVAFNRDGSDDFARLDGSVGGLNNVLTLTSITPPTLSWQPVGSIGALTLQNSAAGAIGILSPSPVSVGTGTLKKFSAGANISLSDNGTTITITGSAGSSITLQDVVASGSTLMASSPVSSGTAQFKRLQAGSNITLTNNGTSSITIAASAGSSLTIQDVATSGSAMLASSPVSSGTAQVKRLVAGTNMTLTNNGTNSITLASATFTIQDSVASGSALLASSPVSSGATAKVKKLVAGTNISLTNNGTGSITIASITGTSIKLQDVATSGTALMASSPVSSGTAQIKRLVAGTNITLTSNGTNSVSIAAITGTSIKLQNVATSGTVMLASSPVSSGTAQIKRLVAGANITLTSNGTSSVSIAATSGSSIILQNVATNGTTLLASSPVSSGTAQIKRLVAGANIVLTANGTSSVSIAATTAASTVDRITVASGSNSNPSASTSITMISVTGASGDATGTLQSGTTDGQMKTIGTAALAGTTQYVLTTPALIDANGNTVNTLTFNTGGMTIQLIWDNINARWMFANTGAIAS